MANRVCVIGAGIAGLTTAKVLHEDGFDVTVFEKAASLGGVWAASRTYPDLRTNNPRETYAFSDHPYPETADHYPTAAQVRAYLESYVERFGLRSLIRFNTEVAEVRDVLPEAGTESTFEVAVCPASGDPQTLAFDFVAVCNGVFSTPYVPEIKGRERFSGRTVHSSELANVEVDGGTRVVVIGAGKSALDCATWASQRGAPTILVFRQPHWMVPRFFFGLARADYVLLNRFSELFLKYHRLTRTEAILHGPGKFLVRLWWRQNSSLIRLLLRMPAVLRPDNSLPSGFENIAVGEEFYHALRQGKIQAERASALQFTESGIELSNGESVDAALVIFATGWQQGVPFPSPKLRAAIQRDGRFQLYRFILPARECRLGFVGYASSIACQFTSEIAAHWLSECFQGRLQLPSVAEMEQEITGVQRWLSEVFPHRDQGYFIGPYLAHYTDELLRDMGLSTRRAANILAEHLGPFRPSRYATLAAERRELNTPINLGAENRASAKSTA